MRRDPSGRFVVAFVIVLAACGAEDEAAVPTVEQGPSSAPVIDVEPAHGGTVVAAGPHPVEVVAHRSGEVYAHVLGDAPPPRDVELTVGVPLRGRATPRPVRLRWDPRESRYEGRVRRLEIVPGPVDVTLVVAGVVYVGHVDVIVVAPAIVVPVVEVRGKHKWKGKHGHRRGVIVVR